MIVLTILNAWEWFHDVALDRTVAAVIDVVFVLIALCVIVASFLALEIMRFKVDECRGLSAELVLPVFPPTNKKWEAQVQQPIQCGNDC